MYGSPLHLTAAANSSLGQNKGLLDHASGWAQAVPLASAILRQFPSAVKPLLGPLLSLPAYRHHNGYTKVVVPEIVRRQQTYAGVSKEDKPNDFLQWQIDRAAASGIASESDPRTIAARMLAVNFAAIHTSTFSITQSIFDLVSSDPGNVASLREESTAALAATDNEWSKSTLQHLVKHDSVLRESSRLGSFLSVGLVRRVIAPEGLIAPNGTVCPYDSWIGVPTNGVHNDLAIYPEGDKYKPFRFSDAREAEAKLEVEGEGLSKESEREALIKKANLSFVSVSPTYHPFGHGRHACPGRFFAANELKLLLAYMVRNYDFQFIDSRPPSEWVGPVLIPPRKATIRVRKRAA